MKLQYLNKVVQKYQYAEAPTINPNIRSYRRKFCSHTSWCPDVTERKNIPIKCL